MNKRKNILVVIGSIFILIVAFITIILIQNNKKELVTNTSTTIESTTTIKQSSIKNKSNKKTTTTSTSKENKTSKNNTTKEITSNTSKVKSTKGTTTTKKETTINSNKGTTTTKTTTTKKTTTSTTVDEVDSLRNKLESTYHITIKYGNELGNYRPKGLTPTKMTDKEQIKKHLKLIENELKKYPTGFFKEFSGMPLTIYLVSSVPGNAFAGFTDKEFMNNIKITLTDTYFFEYTFNHEIMHYIDAYLEIKMYPNNPYDEYTRLNPQGYQYGRVIQEYNYNQQVRGAYFINDYSQSSVREDRAEVFKLMITRVYKPVGMFDSGETIQKKALVIDKQIRENFKTAKGTLYWDKIVK